MSEWTDGYRAALRDVGNLLRSRDLLDDVRIGEILQGLPQRRQLLFNELLADLQQDALAIEHEQGNKLQKRRLAAAREALPLFGDEP